MTGKNGCFSSESSIAQRAETHRGSVPLLSGVRSTRKAQCCESPYDCQHCRCDDQGYFSGSVPILERTHGHEVDFGEVVTVGFRNCE